MGSTTENEPIVLAGGSEDPHIEAVADQLRTKGQDPVCFDPKTFPEETPLSLGNSPEHIQLQGNALPRPAAVYIRSLSLHPLSYEVDVEEEMEANWQTTLIAFREREEMLRSLFLRWEHLNVPLYNPVSINNVIRKPYQLSVLDSAGLPVPDTLWTNDPEEVRDFAGKHDVIYKPIRGGASTKQLSDDDLSDERLQFLANSPVTFQQLLPGRDIRVYVLDGKVIGSFHIHTDDLDYRQNEEDIEQISLDEKIRDRCRKTASVLNLRFTGIDLKEDSNGTLRVLEANPSPMFLGFDRSTNSTMLEQLSDTLLHHAGK